MKKNKRIWVVIAFIILAVLGIVLISNSQKNIRKAEVISIRNGNNGELIELDEEANKAFVSEFNAIKKNISGINLWRLGYNYKILLNEELTKDITVRGNNTISAGFFDYETEEDIVKLIEKYVGQSY